jgi:hypothetical protein
MAHHDDNQRDLDAPTPPGGPLRQDAPTADVNPGPQETHAAPEPEPTVQPSSTPDGPQVVPAPPSPAAEPGPDSAQAENAGTSLDQPSDGSGAE